MADPSPDLRAAVQRMIDNGEPEENIATFIRAYKPQQSPMNWSRIPDPDGAMALSRVAEANPGAAAAGAAGGFMAGAGSSGPGMLQQAATHPLTTGVLGAIEGYRRNGLLGALEGGVLGSTTGKAVGSLGRIAQGLSKLGTTAEAAAPAATSATRLVLTPEEIAAQQAMTNAWQREAQLRGLRTAAQGGKNWLAPLTPGQP